MAWSSCSILPREPLQAPRATGGAGLGFGLKCTQGRSGSQGPEISLLSASPLWLLRA